MVEGTPFFFFASLLGGWEGGLGCRDGDGMGWGFVMGETCYLDLR